MREGHEGLVRPSHPGFSAGGGHPSFGGNPGGKGADGDGMLTDVANQ